MSLCTLSVCVREFSHACFSVAGPRRVEQLQVVNVSSSQVWLSWLVQAARHAAVSRVHVSLLPSDGGKARTAVLNSSTTEHSFRCSAHTHTHTFPLSPRSGSLQHRTCPLSGAGVLPHCALLCAVRLSFTRGQCFPR